jgi:hypothetical protein
MRLCNVLISLGLVLTAWGCGAGESGEAAVMVFNIDWSHPRVVYDAWGEARENPTTGVAYPFAVVSQGIETGAEVDLIAGRSTTDGSVLSTGSDVIMAEERIMATSPIDAEGRAEFGPLDVAMDRWSIRSNTIPYKYLCGTTVIAARAYRMAEGEVPGRQFLAATWFSMVTEPCED